MYDISCGYFLLPKESLFYIYGTTGDKKDVQKVLQLLLDYASKRLKKISKEEWIEYKEKYLHWLLTNIQNNSFTMQMVGEYFMTTDEILNLRKKIALIESLTIGEMKNFMEKALEVNMMNVFVINPQ